LFGNRVKEGPEFLLGDETDQSTFHEEEEEEQQQQQQQQDQLWKVD